ncbi:MAG TPA: hypothetical protein VGS20_06205 [Candidatus Acidoferrales bacterium]|nr:hypothetical protein [Candidatus Acidoferrales bacterium]
MFWAIPRAKTGSCTWVLALAALALVGVTPTPARAQQSLALSCTGTCGGSIAESFTPTSIIAGKTLSVTVTISATFSGQPTEADISSVAVTLGEGADADLFALSGGITTTCSGAAWTGSIAAGTLTLTASPAVVLPASGDSCTVTFTLSVNGDATGQSITQGYSWSGDCPAPSAVPACVALPGSASGSVGLNIDTCGVSLTKAIACDQSLGAGATFTSGSSTEDCEGFVGDPIAVKYTVNNTQSGVFAEPLDSCVVHDILGSTPAGSGGTNFIDDFSVVGSIAAGASSSSSALTLLSGVPLTCSSATNSDAARVTCSCGTTGTTVTADSLGGFTCETCGVNVDKQVQCPASTGTTYDVECCKTGSTTEPFGCVPAAINPNCDPSNGQTQSSNCVGLDAYCSDGTEPVAGVCPAGTTLVAAQNIGVAYKIENTGSDAVTCSGTGLGLTDSDVAIAGGSTVTVNALGPNGCTTGAPGCTNGFTQTVTETPACSTTFSPTSTNEPDTATLKCSCNTLPNNAEVKDVTSSDVADFVCESPGLNIVKTCGPQNGSSQSPVTVTVSNSGTAAVGNCTVTDNYASGASTAACTGTDIGGGTKTAVTLTSSPAGTPTSGFSVAAAGSVTFDGTISGLAATTCNQANISCTTVAGQTITSPVGDFAQATCPVGTGCETRTPGFWGTHPEITEAVLNSVAGGILNCGVKMLAADDEPATACSAGEDLCSQGQDSNTLGIDPTDIQLARQCMSANLNLQVSAVDGGSCSTITDSDTGVPLPSNIESLINECCNVVCTNPGTAANAPLVGACLTELDEFNNQFDNVTLPNATILNKPGSAEPDDCQSENGNGYVNDFAGSVVNPNTSTCGGPGRTYVTKKTGKK